MRWTWSGFLPNLVRRSGWPFCSEPKAAACRPRGPGVRSCVRQSPWLQASTRSMWRPRPQSPATCLARFPPVPAALPANRPIGSSEFQVGAREGQAALVGGLELPILAFGQDDLWVAYGTYLAHVIGVRAVEDEDCEIDSHLSCCETDPLSGVHGGEHVADELVELFIEFPDGPGLGVHHWSAPPDDGQHSASGSEVANSQIGSRVHVSTLPSSRM